MSLDRLKLLVACFAIVPGLEGDEKERVVTGSNEAEQTESHDAGRGLNSGCVSNDLIHLRGGLRGAFERSAIGELQVHVGVTLIFVRQKARWEMLGKESAGRAKSQQQHDH